MSDEWIVKNPDVPSENRLFEALGKDESLFKEIIDSKYQKILAEVAPNGSITYKLINSEGYVVQGDAGIFNF
jgi:hypothetical protein